MSAQSLARLAGPMSLVTGVLLAGTQLVQLSLIRDDKLETLTDPLYRANAVVQFAVMCLLLVTVLAIHARQADRAGVAGMIAAVVGTVNLAGNYWFEAFVTPWLADTEPQFLDNEPAGLLTVGGATSYGLFALGWILFAVACLRTRVYPRAVSIALLAGGLIGIQMVQPPLGVPLAAALVWLGVWALRHPVARPAAAAAAEPAVRV